MKTPASTNERLEDTFEQEWCSDEPVARAHEPHDPDLLAARVDRKSDGVVDEDQRDRAQHEDEGYLDPAHDLSEREELLDDLLAVLE